jgi:hypothetical protein
MSLLVRGQGIVKGKIGIKSNNCNTLQQVSPARILANQVLIYGILPSMSNIITLYHGSIHSFDKIDVSMGKPYKDFGIGFYTSRDRVHAEKMALRNKDIELSRITKRNVVNPINAFLYSFDYDLNNLKSGELLTTGELAIKEFKTADRDWMRFVVLNRSNQERQHSYDMVLGPTANDNTLTAIGLFFAGAYGNIQNDISIDRLIEQLEPGRLPYQYFFGSPKAAELLIFKAREIITEGETS